MELPSILEKEYTGLNDELGPVFWGQSSNCELVVSNY